MRIDGIYDLKAWKALKDLEVYDLALNFHPLSLSFCQLKDAREIVQKQRQSLGGSTWLQFQDDSELVIRRTLEELSLKSSEAQSKGAKKETKGPYLEFLKKRDLSFYEQFSLPFYIHYESDEHLYSSLRSELLRGVVISYRFLHDLMLKNQQEHFCHALQQVCHAQQLEVILCRKWDDQILPSLLQSSFFDILSLPLDSHLEKHYRCLDQEKLKDSIACTRSFFPKNSSHSLLAPLPEDSYGP